MNFRKILRMSPRLAVALIFLLHFLLFGLNSARGQEGIKLIYPWGEQASPKDFVSTFYKIALGLAGASALGVIIFGGILWALSEAVTSKQQAMEYIKGALWGLLLLLGAYLILYTINPNLVQLSNPNLNP